MVPRMPRSYLSPGGYPSEETASSTSPDAINGTLTINTDATRVRVVVYCRAVEATFERIKEEEEERRKGSNPVWKSKSTRRCKWRDADHLSLTLLGRIWSFSHPARSRDLPTPVRQTARGAAD